MTSKTTVKTSQAVWRKFWQGEDGHQALIATPNAPLIAWMLFMFVGWLLPAGRLDNAVQFISTSFLFVWAWLELYTGRAYLRRLLGLVIIIYIVKNHIG